MTHKQLQGSECFIAPEPTLVKHSSFKRLSFQLSRKFSHDRSSKPRSTQRRFYNQTFPKTSNKLAINLQLFLIKTLQKAALIELSKETAVFRLRSGVVVLQSCQLSCNQQFLKGLFISQVRFCSMSSSGRLLLISTDFQLFVLEIKKLPYQFLFRRVCFYFNFDSFKANADLLLLYNQRDKLHQLFVFQISTGRINTLRISRNHLTAIQVFNQYIYAVNAWGKLLKSDKVSFSGGKIQMHYCQLQLTVKDLIVLKQNEHSQIMLLFSNYDYGLLVDDEVLQVQRMQSSWVRHWEERGEVVFQLQNGCIKSAVLVDGKVYWMSK